MTENQTTARKPEQMSASQKSSGTLAAQYGAIGSAAVVAALQFRKPAVAKR